MDSKELRNLQEAYMEVVENQQQLDEISDRKVKGMLRKRDAQDVDSGGISGAWMARRRAHQAAARRNERTGSNVKVHPKLSTEEVDFFDVILEHLVAEGFADTNEAALAIMANMSEEWKQSIVEGEEKKEEPQKPFTGEGPKKPKGWKPTGPKLKTGQRPGYAR